MKGRTFLLGEYGKGEWYVAESELNRRLDMIRDKGYTGDPIAVLLHGEGEKGESNFGHFLKACD